MTTALIITTYNRPEALELVLLSVAQQTCLPSEIIIADDGSSDETKKLIEEISSRISVPILHAWQADMGFRAAMARNNALRMANSTYIIMIDGDMVLHPGFIQDHIDVSEEGTFVQGGRVLLSEKKTEEVLGLKSLAFSIFGKGIQNRKNALRSPLLSYFFSKVNQSIHGIKTCNLALFRKDVLAINGFDNTFVGWGREDSEFAVRLLNSGLKRKNIRFLAIAYHLYHQENPRKSLPENDKRLQQSIDAKSVWCKDGIQ